MVTEPPGAEEAEPEKLLADPGAAGFTVKEAVGAWSGVIATPSGVVPTVMRAPGLLVATVTGVTLLDE